MQDQPFIDEITRPESGRQIASEVGAECQGDCWTDIQPMPVSGPEGSVLFHGMMMDVTGRKRVDDTLKFIAQRGWMQGGESFLIALARHLGQSLQVDYVIIDKLDQDPTFAETVALYAKGCVLPNMRYSLGGTPCENVMEGALCCYPGNVQQQFPEDALLVEMQVESYAGIPLWDSTGKVIGLMAVMDGKPMPDTAFITSMLQLVATRVVAEMERELSERGLLEARQFLSQVVDSIANPVFVKDRQHRWILLNQAFCEFIGHPMERLLGKSDYDFFPAHEADVFRAKDERVFNSGKEDVNEEELTDADGVTHTIITKKTCYTHHLGQQYLVGNILDITERKQMEAALSRREHEFRALVENLPTAVVRYDRHFRRVYINQAYMQIIGRSESDIIGTSVKEVWRADNMSPEAYMAVLAEVMKSGIQKEVSLEWTDSHGRLISHAMKIVPEYDAQGQVVSVLALGFDLSDRRQQQIVEAKRQSIFEKMAHGDPIDKILEQVALYVEYSKCGLHCGILLLDEDKKKLQMIAAPSFPDAYRVQLNSRLLDEESGHCYRWLASSFRSERIVVEDVSQHPCWALCQSFVQEISKAACWSEPIFSSSNQLLGVVNIFSPQAGQPDIADLALIQQASYLSSIAIERNRIEQKMYRQASYDALTGLPNRRLFGDRLREEILKAERAGYRLAVLFIDLDRFKEVNDTLGHEAGDDLLVQAAERIRSCVRESDTVGRLGGDEFVLILPEVGEIAPLHRVAQNIVNVLARPFLIGEHQTYVSASIGVAGYPRDAENAETLISCADQAMYAAKGTGRNSFSFFNPKMLAQAQQRLQLLNDLRGALDKGQLEVFYQPIINVNTGLAIKAEALLRWRHPDLGWISPDQFIPMAEETDMIHEIGNWVFCESANTAKRWHALHEDKAPYQISVNLSPRQFARGDPDVFCIDYLQTIGLDPAFMVIEITEGLLLDDQEDVMNKLRRFHQAGMQLALDDFGTGYSAMAYLKKFNIDYLKIDRSFVRDLEIDPSDRAIAEAIVVMARRLGLKTIAEGVETEGQLNLLADAGCEYIQGYLFAKPMPVEVFLDYVQSQGHAS